MRIRLKTSLLFVFLALIFTGPALAGGIVYVDSYHEGYAWSDEITQGIKDTLKGKDVDFSIIRMDTKRNKDLDFIRKAAREAHIKIEGSDPDVIIASDDNASKYLIHPYYLNSRRPVIFCGLNWDASGYGFPAKNVTGILEITPIEKIAQALKMMAKGNRIGFIGPDTLTSRKELEYCNKALDVEMDAFFAKDAEDWKQGFLSLQKRADMVVIDSDGGLYDDVAASLTKFVEENTTVPTGTGYGFMSRYAMVAYGKSAREQGEWAAQAALKVLAGNKIASIPMDRGKEEDLSLNFRIAKEAGVTIPDSLIEKATCITQ